MGSAPSPPQITNPNTTAAQQQGYNTAAGEASQAGSMVNQSNPYGSLTYQQTGTAPDGTPLYTATQSLSPVQQGIYGNYTTGQTTAGQQANKLLTGANYGAQSPTDAIGTQTTGIMGGLMKQEGDYMAPFFKQQTDSLTAQLANQGLTPGDPGYDNAVANLQKSQASTMENYAAQTQPQVYGEAVTNYQMPWQMASSQFGFASPTNLNTTFGNTPSLNVQPANLIGATANAYQAQQQAYQDQMQQYQSMMSGIFGIPTAILGGWAKGGGLQSLAGALPFLGA